MRLIDADAYEHAVQGNPYVSDSVKRYVRCSIQSQPTIDAVPVIRCKDCKHHRGENACEKDGCYGWYDTDYCSRAERRGEE